MVSNYCLILLLSFLSPCSDTCQHTYVYTHIHTCYFLLLCSIFFLFWGYWSSNLWTQGLLVLASQALYHCVAFLENSTSHVLSTDMRAVSFCYHKKYCCDHDNMPQLAHTRSFADVVGMFLVLLGPICCSAVGRYTLTIMQALTWGCRLVNLCQSGR
jgi:hypothetical protein